MLIIIYIANRWRGYLLLFFNVILLNCYCGMTIHR